MCEVHVYPRPGRRIRVYPEGGMETEFYMNGLGWVIDDHHAVSDKDMADWLREAAKLTTDVAGDLS